MNLEQFFSHDAVVPMKKLTEYTTTEATSYIQLDLVGNTWGEHKFVLLQFTPGEGNSSSSCNMTFNGSKNNWYYSSLSSPGATQGLPTVYSNEPFSILFFSGNDTVSGIAGIAKVNMDLIFCRSLLPSTRQQSLEIQSSSSSDTSFAAGSRIEIWGIW